MLSASKALYVVKVTLGLLVLLLGVYGFVSEVQPAYPLEQWLFWPMASVWGYCALLNLAWLSIGYAVLTRVLQLRSLRTVESLALSAPLGVLTFTLCLYAAGAVALFRPWFALVLAFAFVAIGARYLPELTRKFHEEREEFGVPSTLTRVLYAAGVVCLGLMYLQLMTPEALNYDSTWYHLTVSEAYAREGRIVPFPANYMMNMPQLWSVSQTWAFLVPGLTPQLRWMLALHDEFTLFLWTLVGVNAVVAWMLGGQRRARVAWVGFFLFPGIFVYDSNLGGAADHALAFFALPLLLALGRFLVDFDLRWGVLLGAFLGASFLTKFQASYLALPTLLVLVAAWLRLFARAWLARKQRALGGKENVRALLYAPLTIAGTALLCAGPHFLRNAIFYKNPAYPLMQGLFTHSTPALANSEFLVEYVLKDYTWRPHGTWFENARAALRHFVTFSFKPHYSFHHDVPSFGSLFTLLLPMLLFVRRRRHIALGAALGSAAILTWAMTFLVDRNLQAFTPVLVATTVALLLETWDLGWPLRVGLVPLVALQIVWGADAMFYSGHGRLADSIELIRSGIEGRSERRFDGYRRAYLALDRELPKDAVVLVHHQHPTLGINRKLLLDWTGFQGLVDYGSTRTPAEVYRHFRQLGVTHVIDMPGAATGTKQEQVVFAAFEERFLTARERIGGFLVMKMPEKPPPDEPPYRVLSLGLSGYADGLYAIEKLNTPEAAPDHLKVFADPDLPFPSDPTARLTLLNQADAVLIGSGYQLDSAFSGALSAKTSDSVSIEGGLSVRLLSRTPN